MPTQQLATALSPLLALWLLDSKKGQGRGGCECQLIVTWCSGLLLGGQSRTLGLPPQGAWPSTRLSGTVSVSTTVSPESTALGPLGRALLGLPIPCFPDSALRQKARILLLTPALTRLETRPTWGCREDKRDDGGASALLLRRKGLSMTPTSHHLHISPCAQSRRCCLKHVQALAGPSPARRGVTGRLWGSSRNTCWLCGLVHTGSRKQSPTSF